MEWTWTYAGAVPKCERTWTVLEGVQICRCSNFDYHPRIVANLDLLTMLEAAIGSCDSQSQGECGLRRKLVGNFSEGPVMGPPLRQNLDNLAGVGLKSRS